MKEEDAAMSVKCAQCGMENQEDDRYCEECGGRLEAGASGGVGESSPGGGDDASSETGAGSADEAGAEDEAPGPRGGACESCGADLADDVVYCSACGARVGTGGEEVSGPPEAGRCSTCGEFTDAGDAFCSVCGSRVDAGTGVSETQGAGPAAPATAEGADFYLEVVAGREKDRVFPLRGEEVTIGRSTENEIILETDGYVSGHHTRLIQEGGAWYVEDMGSTNGTFLKLRGRFRLGLDDEIKVGQSIFRFGARGSEDQGECP